MYLKSISYLNYRNLVSDFVEFSDNINIFVGSNGQGKTNILEAIYIISIAKSFKTNKSDNIINYNQNMFEVEANVFKNELPYLISYSYSKKKRFININGNSLKQYKDLIGFLNAVLFVPEDLLLFKGQPSIRRRMIDIELCKLDSTYTNTLIRYQKLIKDRNILLKSNTFDKLLIESLNIQLVRHGEYLFNIRDIFFKKFIHIVNDFYKKLSDKDDIVEIEYISNIHRYGSYTDSLIESLNKDILLKQTSIGIHRDDFIVYLNGHNIAHYASQGENRSIVLAFKLALVEYIYLEVKEYPILLLDDVLSELDNLRQDNLINILSKDIQCFITTTSLEGVASFTNRNKKIFNVENGIIKEDK